VALRQESEPAYAASVTDAAVSATVRTATVAAITAESTITSVATPAAIATVASEAAEAASEAALAATEAAVSTAIATVAASVDAGLLFVTDDGDTPGEELTDQVHAAAESLGGVCRLGPAAVGGVGKTRTASKPRRSPS